MTWRWVPAVVLAAAVAGLAAIGASAMDDGLTYYQTPTEAVRQHPGDAEVRISGILVPGSVVQTDAGARLTLSDGATDVQVTYPGQMPDVLQEGEGAVVTGRLGHDGVLAATELVLRHSNEYRPAP